MKKSTLTSEAPSSIHPTRIVINTSFTINYLKLANQQPFITATCIMVEQKYILNLVKIHLRTGKNTDVNYYNYIEKPEDIY